MVESPETLHGGPLASNGLSDLGRGLLARWGKLLGSRSRAVILGCVLWGWFGGVFRVLRFRVERAMVEWWGIGVQFLVVTFAKDGRSSSRGAVDVTQISILSARLIHRRTERIGGRRCMCRWGTSRNSEVYIFVSEMKWDVSTLRCFGYL